MRFVTIRGLICPSIVKLTIPSKQTVPDGQIVIEDRALYNGHFQLQRPRKGIVKLSEFDQK